MLETGSKGEDQEEDGRMKWRGKRKRWDSATGRPKRKIWKNGKE